MGISPKAIEVVRAVDGSCELELSGSALAAARSLGIDSLALSMSHEGDTAVAMVVAERTGPNPRAPQSKTSKRSPSRAGRRR